MEVLFKKLVENVDNTYFRHRIAKTFSEMGLLVLPDWRLMITQDDIKHWKLEKQKLETEFKTLNMSQEELYNITFSTEVMYRIAARYYYKTEDYPNSNPYEFITNLDE